MVVQHAAVAALSMGPRGGSAVEDMVSQYQSRRDLVVDQVKSIPGIGLSIPQGAFYALLDMSFFVGDDVHAEGFGKIPDGDALCRYLLEQAEVLGNSTIHSWIV